MYVKRILFLGIEKMLGGKPAKTNEKPVTEQDQMMLEKMSMLDAEYQKSRRPRQDS